jgi:hypothetical protein
MTIDKRIARMRRVAYDLGKRRSVAWLYQGHCVCADWPRS